MICDHLNSHTRYAFLGPRFAAAFDYLRRASAGEFSEGKTVIIPDEVWASVVRKSGRSVTASGFEYHRRFADVHLCLAGREQIGWRLDAAGLSVRAAFKDEEDFGLYDGTADELLPLSGGRFAIFFPGELHAPLIGEGELTKVCVKVRCD